MKSFKTKKQIFKYIDKKFSKAKAVLIRGSSLKKPLRAFSDIDVEVYGKKRKPYYEIVFLKAKPILITAYFYKYKKGKLKPDFSKDKYTAKEKIVREVQLAIDFMFKYLRSKDKKDLKSVEKRLK